MRRVGTLVPEYSEVRDENGYVVSAKSDVVEVLECEECFALVRKGSEAKHNLRCPGRVPADRQYFGSRF